MMGPTRVTQLSGWREDTWSSPALACDPLLQLAGLPVLTQRMQVAGEVGGRGQGVGVVFAQDPTPAGEGVLVQGAGLLVLTQRPQVAGEVGGRGQGTGVVLAQDPTLAGEGVLGQGVGLLVVTC
jgi:hypothetical protein